MNLCNFRNIIFRLFEDKINMPSDYPHNTKSEKLEEKSESEWESKFEESNNEIRKVKNVIMK